MRFLIGYTESYSLFPLIGPICSFNTLKKFCDKSRSNFEKNEKKIILVYWRINLTCDGKETHEMLS